MRRTLTAVVALCALATAGCGGDDAPRPSAGDRGAQPPAPTELTAAQAHPAAPLTAGTLQRVPDVAAARERLAFADLDGLRAAADLPVARATLLRRVLGATGAATARAAASGTAVQLATKATILDGGTAAARTIHGASGALARRLADPRPERSAITPAAPSAAQSCLGTTLAQTILGPATMGDDAALGVGLATSQDAPAGLQLRICGAPRYIRHLHAMERALKARFGDLETADGRAPIIGEQEIGEREIVSATLPADALPTAQLLDFLSGAEELRALAW